MKRIIALLILSCLFSADVFPQVFNKFITFPGVDSISYTSVRAFPDSITGGYLVSFSYGSTSNLASALLSTDINGNVLSVKKHPSRIFIEERCSDGGFIFCSGKLLIKTDSLLQVQWAKSVFVPNSTYGLGSPKQHGNNYYAWHAQLTSFFAPGNSIVTSTIILFKFDSLGNVIDNIIFADTSGLSTQYYINGRDYCIAADGSIYISMNLHPWFAGGTCNFYASVVKLDSNLNIVWSKRYPTANHDYGFLLLPLSDGNLLLSGGSSYHPTACHDYHYVIKKIDTSGTILFQKNFRHPVNVTDESPIGTAELNDNRLVLNGTVYDSTFSNATGYLLHLDSAGNQLGSRKLDYPYYPGMLHRLKATNGIIPVAGAYTLGNQFMADTLLFITTDMNLSFDCNSLPDFFTDTVPTNPWSNITIPTINYTFAFTYTIYGNVTNLTGFSFNACPLPTYASELHVNSFDELVSPNPTTDELTINGFSSSGKKEINIYNTLGEKILSKEFHGEQIKLDVKNLAAGIYVVKVLAGDKMFVKKVVKE